MYSWLNPNITGKHISTVEKSTKKAKNVSPSCLCHCVALNHSRHEQKHAVKIDLNSQSKQKQAR